MVSQSGSTCLSRQFQESHNILTIYAPLSINPLGIYSVEVYSCHVHLNVQICHYGSTLCDVAPQKHIISFLFDITTYKKNKGRWSLMGGGHGKISSFRGLVGSFLKKRYGNFQFSNRLFVFLYHSISFHTLPYSFAVRCKVNCSQRLLAVCHN